MNSGRTLKEKYKTRKYKLRLYLLLKIFLIYFSITANLKSGFNFHAATLSLLLLFQPSAGMVPAACLEKHIYVLGALLQ